MSRPESNNVQTLITEHLGLWSSAITAKSTTGRGSSKKIELYGVKKLRELILELAVRGKLVPQDPNDEPASELLERAAVEKEALIKSGEIKRSKASQGIDSENIPFAVPTTWAWARFPDVASYGPGKTPPTKNSVYWDGDFNWVSIADMEDRGTINKTAKTITNEAVEAVFKKGPVPAGTLLMSFKLTVGKVSVLNVDAFHNEAIISIFPFRGISQKYLINILPERALAGEQKKAIKGNTLNSESLSLILLPIPPIEEQHRIVAKVDELMALCDQLENQTEQSLDAHATLADTLLDALTQAQSHTELMENWQRLEENWDILFPSTIAGCRAIDKLKQTILQLAVMGKLVAQDANDEPASELLNRIAAEKEQLVKDKKIKKQKPLPPITDEEKPFELPEGWEWCKFDHIAKNEKNALKAGPFGSALKKTMYVESGYKIYGQEQVISNDENIGDYYINEEKYRALESCRVQPGDILISLVGTIGKVLILSNSCQRGIINPRLVKLGLYPDVYREYIRLVLGSQLIQDELYEKSHGSTMNVLNLGLLRDLIFPFPPVEEQKRIVAKVEELTSLCDQLKRRLQTAQHTQQHFTDAVVAGALASNADKCEA